MVSTVTAHSIQEQILQDTQSCETLLKLLTEEREALKERDLEALERIIKDKSVHLEALEASARQRSVWAGGKPEDTRERWQEILSELDNETLDKRWQKLKSLMQLCSQENQVNGKLLARNHQIYSRLVELVCGQQAAPSLYDAKGGSNNSGTSNLVGEA